MTRSLWLGLGALAGSLVGHALRRAYRKRRNRGRDEDRDAEQPGLLRQALGGPASVLAATSLSRSLADQLPLDRDDPRAQGAVGFGVGLVLVLLAEPLRRFLPL